MNNDLGDSTELADRAETFHKIVVVRTVIATWHSVKYLGKQ